MLYKNAVVTLALMPLAIMSLLPHVAYASPAAELEARGDFPPALRRDWNGLEEMQKRGSGKDKKKHGKDGKKSKRDFAEIVDLEERGKKGGKKGKPTKHGRDFDLEARGGTPKSAAPKDGKDGKSHTTHSTHTTSTTHTTHTTSTTHTTHTTKTSTTSTEHQTQTHKN